MYRRTGYRFWLPDVRLQRNYNSVSSVAILPVYTVFNQLKSDLWCRIPGTHDLYIKIIYSLRKARETIRLSRTVFRMSKLLNSVYNRIYISASFLPILKNYSDNALFEYEPVLLNVYLSNYLAFSDTGVPIAGHIRFPSRISLIIFEKGRISGHHYR